MKATCEPCGERYNTLNAEESYPHDLHAIYEAEPCEQPTRHGDSDYCDRCLWTLNWHDMDEAAIKRIRKVFQETLARVCDELNGRAERKRQEVLAS